METFEDFLRSLLYKTLTIYVTNFSNYGLYYKGTLFQVNNDYISLILEVGQKDYIFGRRQRKLFINFNKPFNPTDIILRPGSIVEIPISKIEAVLHYPI